MTVGVTCVFLALLLDSCISEVTWHIFYIGFLSCLCRPMSSDSESSKNEDLLNEREEHEEAGSSAKEDSESDEPNNEQSEKQEVVEEDERMNDEVEEDSENEPGQESRTILQSSASSKEKQLGKSKSDETEDAKAKQKEGELKKSASAPVHGATGNFHADKPKSTTLSFLIFR